MSQSNPKQRENVEQVVTKHSDKKNKETVSIAGRKFVIYPTVFSPLLAPSGSVGLAVAQKPIWQDKFVVELGAGSGIIACLFALAGSRKVLAFDINPDALANTRENVSRLGLANVETRLSNALEALESEEKPDIIYCDPPFSTFREPKNDLEKAFFDAKLNVVRSLLLTLESDERLAKTKVLLCLSSLANANEQLLFSEFKVEAKLFLATTTAWASFTLWEIIKKRL